MLTRTVPVFTVQDMTETVKWYQDVLGFRPISNGVRSSESIVLMGRDSVELLFRKHDEFSPRTHRSWDAYFRLTGVDTLYHEIKDKGEVIRGPEDTFHHDREIEVRDPNGYVLTFGEWEKKKSDVVSIYDLHPVLPVKDIRKTVSWYKDVLGFKGEPWQKKPPFLFAMLYKDKVETFFTKERNFNRLKSQPFGWAVYVRMIGDHIDQFYDSVKEKATVIRELDKTFTGYTEFELADNNGHVLCFSEMNP